MAKLASFGKTGLFDEIVQTLDFAAFQTPLMRVGILVRWVVFAPLIYRAVISETKGPGGRLRSLSMLLDKVLVL